ncbi:MAG: carboxypeptidase regulatory-like domain-containing protein [Ekhidna sp.]|uniref:TonB-dependent receptor n=1 Tax=Ekhidna sp. TaxID=2608089 RepID=UPI0032ED5CFC
MKKFLLLASFIFSGLILLGQGSTTSAMNGRITDANGEALIGATVLAVYTPTGAEYGNISDVDGYYRIPNMTVGGPYTVTVSYIGFETYTEENVYLNLGQSYKLSMELRESAQALSEVVVTASSGLIDGNRTGADTKVGKEQISTLPNASRGLNDFTRLTPQASFTSGGGLSIAGTNNRYNSIFIDGASSNDVFGLAGNGQNGGQIDNYPLISVDALDQISVAVAPYDVTLSGFAGGGISAVTRSGTNEYEGSVYYFVRNQKLSGKTPKFISDPADIERERLAEFSAKTYGFRAGGPIIPNKLFFFVNGEIQREETPVPFDFASYTGSATQADIDNLISTLDGLGYAPGSYEDVIRKLEAERFLIKFDYNLSKQHKISLRHSYNKGENFSPSGSFTTGIRFANSGVFFPNTTNATTLEVRSNFDNISNKLIIGYTSVSDDRDPLGSPFPYIDITQGDVEVGSEQFSTANLLTQKIFTVTDNFNLYKGKHTITVGTHNEYYDMNNVFIRQNFGSYRYNTIADFIADVNGASGLAFQYDRSYSLIDNTTGDNTGASAAFKALQLGFYVQDEFQVNSKLKLTGGLRVDIPMFMDDPGEDTYFNTTAAPLIEAAGYDLKGARAGQAPDAQLLFSPRFGFNYDLNGDQSTQIRGGIGVFTSRIPYVWPGAMYNNNGVTVGGTRQSSGIDFVADPFAQPSKSDFGGTDDIPQGQMDLFAADFKFPQVLRASIAVDQKLPGGIIGTIEGIYTKNINAIFYENVNLVPSTERFEGTPDNRQRFTNGRIDSNYTAIYLGSNTNKGYTYNFTASLTKPFENGLTANLAYSYTDAYAIFEGTSSQNSSQWRGVYSVDGRNNAPLGRSDFASGSRILASVSYRKEYLNNFATTLSFFYNGQEGDPFSYTYNSGLTGEDSRERALIYVPASQDEIVFADAATADAQWEALERYINEDDYLRSRKGQYTEKNMARLPFVSILDVRLLQDFYLDMSNGKRNTIQLSFDIFNFGNFLNANWGKRYFTPNGDGTSVQLLDFEGFQDGTNIPTYSFDTSLRDKKDIIGKDDSGLISSRWQMQFGIRYIFN